MRRDGGQHRCNGNSIVQPTGLSINILWPRDGEYKSQK